MLLSAIAAFSCVSARASSAEMLSGAASPLGLPPLETHVEGLEWPWGMAFLPDGRALVTERPGRLRMVSADGKVMSPPVKGVPAVDHRGHGGLLDVAIDPRFQRNRWVYLSFTEAGVGADSNRNGLVVARARLSPDGGSLDRLQVLFRQAPLVESNENLGGRLALSRDGYLFITVGDRRVPEERVRAQALDSFHGKTLRLRTNGSVPASNPFARRKGAHGAIWTLGHRNPQGAFVHPATGELWVAEHGPNGGDEINIARKGQNFGWPVVSHGCEYDTCAPIGVGSTQAGMAPALTHWSRPGIAPSNLMFYTGHKMPQWNGHLFVGALAGTALWHLELADGANGPQVIRREALHAGLGQRIRDVRQGPDGRIYLLTDGGSARIMRMGP